MSAPRWEWKLPHGADDAPQPQLQLCNSYHNRTVPFVPAAGPQSRQISWYTCGPTVYEVSHMGHARSYLTSDVIRRVLEDYFGYNIHFVMNVTDVDDKIIIKARRAHHLQRFRRSSPQPEEVRDQVQRALQSALQGQQQTVQRLEQDIQAAEAKAAKQPDSATLQRAAEDLRSRLSLAHTAIKRTQDQQQQLERVWQAGEKGQAAADALLESFSGVLAEALDAQAGDVDITDHAVFQQHARRYEADFLRDMDDLGVRRPTAMPRVSEYVPEIVAYISTIIQKGLAYEANGSVYFDTCAFEAAGHQYRKLSPSSATAADELAGDGEADFATSEKRNPRDFALWKASKPGEPTWPSPWGRGRPGWHIECSAMASELIGSRVDIHTGGVDLRFPHHDNELAQAEAYYHGEGSGACDCHQWVNYFLHLGHLHIEGLKMSKSLKNFVTIREALGSFTARQLRLMMCLQPWNAPMTFGEQAKEAMVAREKELRNFFGNVVSTLRETDAVVAQRASSASDPSQRWHSTRWQAEESELNGQLRAAQAGVHAALCDNIDTARALIQLSDLVTAVNKYLAKRPLPHGTPPSGLLPQADLVRRAAEYVLRIVSVLGLVPAASDRLSSFNVDSSGGGAAGVEAWRPFVDAFADFRETVRKEARGPRAKQAPAEAFQDILAACDRARDETLSGLGVRLEDRPDGTSTWKEEDPAVLAAERAQAKAAAAAAAVTKLEKQLKAQTAELEKLEAIAARPSVQEELAAKFSRAGWSDAEGYPAASADGSVDLTASEAQKVAVKARAAVDKARKARAPLSKAQQEDGEQWRSKRQAEVARLQQQLQALRTDDGAETGP